MSVVYLFLISITNFINFRKLVRLGENMINENVDCIGNTCAPPVKDIDIEVKISHSEYNRFERLNDIALLRLSESVSLDNKGQLKYFRIYFTANVFFSVYKYNMSAN